MAVGKQQHVTHDSSQRHCFHDPLRIGVGFLIRPQVSNAPSNLPLFALANAPLGAPPQTNTSTDSATPLFILKGSSTAEPVLG
uniref:Uncharacterized protein n=1 Tax=Helianthus annuus TaxID=4232 RepID=A0A251TYL5_HELAN